MIDSKKRYYGLGWPKNITNDTWSKTKRVHDFETFVEYQYRIFWELSNLQYA